MPLSAPSTTAPGLRLPRQRAGSPPAPPQPPPLPISRAVPRAVTALTAALALAACATAPAPLPSPPSSGAAPTSGAAPSPSPSPSPAPPPPPAPAPAPQPPLDFAALAAAPDRTAEDRALDWSRRPAELLAFLAVRPGMRVAELGAADGYTAELLARAVGPTGTVWAQNTRTMVVMIDRAWPRRLSRPVNRSIVRVDREFVDPLPPEARGLDLVVMSAIYHDTIWLGVDRARMNRAVFEALAPGGAFVVIDSSANPGEADAPYERHRVDEALVRRELEAAGFRLAGESAFLRNPADTRDWSAAPNEAGPRRGQSDRFALRFVRP